MKKLLLLLCFPMAKILLEGSKCLAEMMHQIDITSVVENKEFGKFSLHPSVLQHPSSFTIVYSGQ